MSITWCNSSCQRGMIHNKAVVGMKSYHGLFRPHLTCWTIVRRYWKWLLLRRRYEVWSWVEGRGRHDAHYFHPGDALKVGYLPSPSPQKPCSISFCGSVASPESRDWYVLIAYMTNKINFLCNSECVLRVFCAWASS